MSRTTRPDTEVPVPAVRSTRPEHPVRPVWIVVHVVGMAVAFTAAGAVPVFAAGCSALLGAQLAWRHASPDDGWGPSASRYLRASAAWAAVGAIVPALTLVLLGAVNLDLLALAVAVVLLPFLIGAPLGWFAKLRLRSRPAGKETV